MRYELTDGEWGVIKPMLPNRARGVPRVDDRCTRSAMRTSTTTMNLAAIRLGGPRQFL